jgi:transposase InsO family protein
MPWKESRVVDERVRFIAACADEDESLAEICRRFGISRKTGYKWMDRFDELGPPGLLDQPPVARRHPQQTPSAVLDAVLDVRRQHPFWGPKKLRAWLADRDPTRDWPAASTIGEVLKRHGLVRPRRRRPRVPPGLSPLERGAVPNDVWCADFKGHFALGDRSRCYPLTISDECSRFLLRCQGLASPKHSPTTDGFELTFREFGLPLGIRSDNGPPFASTAVGGLSRLSVEWIRLGIRPLRIEPGEPQQNGVHERMHLTLNEAIQPPAFDLLSQQRAFDCFRHEFNDERPHEAIGMKPPARVYSCSRRAFPDQPREPEYGPGFIVHRCNNTGSASIRGRIFGFSTVLANAHLGVRECGEGRREVFYGPVLLGYVDETTGEPRFERS